MYQGLGSVKCPVAAFFELQLGDLDIPVGKFTPKEIVNLPPGLAILKFVEQALHFTHQGL